MQKLIVLLIGLATALSPINGLQSQNATINLDLDEINSIGLSINATVTISEGSRQQIKVTGPSHLLDELNTEVRERSWEIKYEYPNRKRDNDELDIEIQVTSLKALAISGQGKIKSKGRFSKVAHRSIAVSGAGTISFKGDARKVNIALSGVGEIDVDADADQIHAALSGTGDVTLRGTTDFIQMSASGSGNMGGADLKTKRCKASISGSTVLTAEVTDELDLTVSGSGVFRYRGDPDIRKRTESKSALVKI